MRFGFGNALNTSAGRKGKGKRESRKEAREKVECPKAMNSVRFLSLFCWYGSTQKGKGRRQKRIDMCDDPWKDRRMTCCGLYPLLSLPLVSVVRWMERNTRERANFPSHP